MAVTASWFGEGLYGLVSATTARRFDWVTGDPTQVTLHTSTFVPDKDAHDFANDLTNEVVGTGYSAGGVTLGSKTLTKDTATDEIRMDAADAQWSSSTITARIAAVWNNTAGASSTDPLLGYVDFGSDVASASGLFTIQWASNGVLILDYT